ncbi:hypothetical protein FNV43_RR09129 [Rhamnella rubrinervis]|uniref:Myeloid leukemia factor 1 n=1 Tax=Rhamnella rubrinervis TaxID=2594499 RepID=A0A8K0MJJ9_9ROSA|nr:hypothetical protein FNV43_RR09129 [Rhamnella rubrinervis]
MQGGRGGRNPFFEFGDPFAGFGGFGSFGGQGSLMSSFFDGRDPFDDPFFTRPFGGMLESSFFGPNVNPFVEMHPSGFLEQQAPEPRRSRGPIIEEINSDDGKEDADKEKKENPRKHGRSSNEPYIEDPDDEVIGRESKHLQSRNEYNNMPGYVQSQPQTQGFTFQSSTISYGGANGTYYTSSKTRRTGSDGLTFEESKEADTARREANHRLSRGLHNKGHSVMRKLKSDGKVDTMQTLHNLDEDELVGFEEAWKGNAQKHLPGWTGNLGGYGNAGASNSGYNGQASQGGWALPSTEPSQHSGRVMPDARARAGSPYTQHSSRMKANIGEKSGSSRGRARE